MRTLPCEERYCLPNDRPPGEFANRACYVRAGGSFPARCRSEKACAVRARPVLHGEFETRLPLCLSPYGCDDGHCSRKVTRLTSSSNASRQSNCYQFRRYREEVEGVFPESVIRCSGCLMCFDRWRGFGCRNWSRAREALSAKTLERPIVGDVVRPTVRVHRNRRRTKVFGDQPGE